jgi:hypothetical protein
MGQFELGSVKAERRSGHTRTVPDRRPKDTQNPVALARGLLCSQ